MEPTLRLLLWLCMTLIQSRSTCESQEMLPCYRNDSDTGPCRCMPGYEPIDERCWDINECLQHVCGAHTECVNEFGSYTCQCTPGFQFINSSKHECKDTDECQKNASICGPNGSCINIPGDYICKCKPGFAKSAKDDLKLCKDIDECAQSLCDKRASCLNLDGTYKCTCPPGYSNYTVAGPGGKNSTACRQEFTCPLSSCNDSSGEQAFHCNFTTQLRSLCEPSVSMQIHKNAEEQLTKLLDLLDGLVGLLQQEAGDKEERHRLATMLMQVMESRLRAFAFALSEESMSTRSSQGTELAMKIRTARGGNQSQSSAWLLQDEAEMELNWEATSKEGEALHLAGLLSYKDLGPVLTEAPVEGDEWKQIGKAPRWAYRAGKRNYQVLSRVTAAFVGHTETKSLSVPVNFTFNHEKPVSKPDQQLLCAFWKIVNGNGSWSTEGCRLLQSNGTRTQCQCNHLTSFAVLMAFYDLNDWTLDIITKVGLVVSLVCLFLSILTFLFCRTIRETRTTIHLHLCLVLFAAYVIFLMGAGRPENETACAIVAGLLHYFFLSVFCWMLLEGVELYLLVVQVFKTHSLKHWHIFLVGYGLPAVVVGISAAVYSKGYGTDRHCWLSLTNGFLWSFLAPVCLIILVNAMVFVVTVWRLTEKFADINPDISKLKKLRVLTITAIAQLCILGTTWIFGLFQFSYQTIVMSYIFTILNTLQGLFIFLLHCLLKKQVRDEYYRLLCRGRRDKTQSSDKYSEFSSTASNTLRAHKASQESGI